MSLTLASSSGRPWKWAMENLLSPTCQQWDARIVCQDGHLLWNAAAMSLWSPFVSDLLRGQAGGLCQDCDSPLQVHLPDFAAGTVKSLLLLTARGELQLGSKKEAYQVQALAQVLGTSVQVQALAASDGGGQGGKGRCPHCQSFFPDSASLAAHQEFCQYGLCFLLQQGGGTGRGGGGEDEVEVAGNSNDESEIIVISDEEEESPAANDDQENGSLSTPPPMRGRPQKRRATGLQPPKLNSWTCEVNLACFRRLAREQSAFPLKPLPCPCCGKVSYSVKSFLDHLTLVHFKQHLVQDKFDCSSCDFRTEDREKMLLHRGTTHGEVLRFAFDGGKEMLDYFESSSRKRPTRTEVKMLPHLQNLLRDADEYFQKFVDCQGDPVKLDGAAKYLFRTLFGMGKGQPHSKTQLACTECPYLSINYSMWLQHIGVHFVDKLEEKDISEKCVANGFAGYRCKRCFKTFRTHGKVIVHLGSGHLEALPFVPAFRDRRIFVDYLERCVHRRAR